MGFSRCSNCPNALSAYACSLFNTSGVLSCGYWPDTDRFILDNTQCQPVLMILLHHHRHCSFPIPQSLSWLMGSGQWALLMQSTPQVYAAGTGFLHTHKHRCGSSTYPQTWVRVSEGSQKPYPYPYPLYPWKKPMQVTHTRAHH